MEALAPTARRRPRRDYLIGAICVAVIAIMLWPLVMSFLASVKPAAEASTPPPNYLPRALSLENYRAVAEHGVGVWSYVRNSPRPRAN